MKKIFRTLIYIAAATVAISCAKAVSEGVNTSAKRYFDAWMHVNHPDLKAQWKGQERTDGNGIYVIESTEGSGAIVKDKGFAIVEYTAYNLNGEITAHTNAEQAKQLGTYTSTNYYGPQVWTTISETIQAGLQDAVVGMKVGGRKKVIVPSWLMTYSSYKSVGEYLNHASDYSNAIYDITIKDFTDSIDVWQKDSIERYIVKNYGRLDTFRNDTTGFYYQERASLPEGAKEFPSDTSVYINYTGKLLNGLVFDTTSERVAKDNNLYDSSRTYEPVKVNWGEKYSEISMGSVDESTSVIAGFAMTLWRMKYDPENKDWNDKATGIFISPLGYGYSGTGASIPGYAPLIFEIEIVPAPEK